MNISTLLGGSASSLLGNGTAAAQTSASAATHSVSPYLAKAEQRLQASADMTSTQISKFGLLKSALSDGQAAAKAASALTSNSTPAAVTTALGTLFNTFNASMSAAQAASSATGTGSASDRAKRVVQDLRSALSADPATTDALKKLGLTLQSNGSLAQDARKFASALASDPGATLAALAKVGKKLDALSTSELGSNGTVGVALSTLNAQSQSLSSQQSALQALDAAMAATSAADPFTSTNASAAPTASTAAKGSGLAAYQSNMSGA